MRSHGSKGMKRAGSMALMMGVVLTGTLMGCGGGGGGTCGKVQPCGGDFIGTWTASDACAASGSTTLIDFCPTAPVSYSLSSSGDATFRADGTYTLDTSATGTAIVTIPATCLTMPGLTITCPELEQELQSQISSGSQPGATKASCRTGGGGCICDMTLEAHDTRDSGTYTNSGTELDLSDGDGGAYCVQNNELHLVTVGTINMGQTMGNMYIQSDFVFVKK
jgi:hypothetical protein